MAKRAIDDVVAGSVLQAGGCPHALSQVFHAVRLLRADLLQLGGHEKRWR